MSKSVEIDNGDESQEFIVEDEEVRSFLVGRGIAHPHQQQPQIQRRVREVRERDREEEQLYDQLFDEEEEITEAEEEGELTGGEGRGLEVDGQILTSHNWTPSNSSNGQGHHHSHRRYHPHRHSHHSNHHSHPRLDPEESSSETTTMSLTLSDRNRDHSTASLLDSMERRTQRTYRYGIGLVCVGATLNWLGFAQGHGYVDPLRYLGVACVISGSFCVCLAMCRWLGRPISVSSHRVSGLSRLDYGQDERSGGRQNGDVHVINVSVPMYVPPMHEEYRPTKPPDYEIAVSQEPPPYDEAIKLSPGALFTNSSHTVQTNSDNFFSCGHPSPSHTTNHQHLNLMINPQPQSPTTTTTPTTPNVPTTTTTGTNTLQNLQTESHHHGSSFLPRPESVVMVDASECASANSLNAKIGPPPAYTPSPRHGLTSSSSFSSSQFEGQSSLDGGERLHTSSSTSTFVSNSNSNSTTTSSCPSSAHNNNNNININNSDYALAPVHSYHPSSNTVQRNVTNQRQIESTPPSYSSTTANANLNYNANCDVMTNQLSSSNNSNSNNKNSTATPTTTATLRSSENSLDHSNIINNNNQSVPE